MVDVGCLMRCLRNLHDSEIVGFDLLVRASWSGNQLLPFHRDLSRKNRSESRFLGIISEGPSSSREGGAVPGTKTCGTGRRTFVVTRFVGSKKRSAREGSIRKPACLTHGPFLEHHGLLGDGCCVAGVVVEKEPEKGSHQRIQRLLEGCLRATGG